MQSCFRSPYASRCLCFLLLVAPSSGCDGGETSRDTDALDATGGAGGNSAGSGSGSTDPSPSSPTPSSGPNSDDSANGSYGGGNFGGGGTKNGADANGPGPSNAGGGSNPSGGDAGSESGGGTSNPFGGNGGIDNSGPSSGGNSGMSQGGVENGGLGGNGTAGSESGDGGTNGSAGETNGGTPSGGAGPGGSGNAGESNGGTPSGGAGGSSEPSGGAGRGPSGAGVDLFGITEFYDSAASGASWNSEHWSEGPYSITERRDENDPSGLSGMRGEGELEVEGNGELVMSGSEPRIYIYPEEGEEWLNVEVTVYYQRVADEDTAWAGLVIGVRSGPDGHTTDTACDAHTYYSRLRNDGNADFEKELEHSPSSTRASTDLEDFLPPDGEASEGQWIGWKYVSYNIPGEDALKLEAYIDLSGGENGGDWQLVNETIDEGGWFTDTDCEQYSPENGESDFVWLDGGVVFVRNTNVEEARYRWVSIREIAPPN